MNERKDVDRGVARKRATPEYKASYRAAQLAHALGRQIHGAREARGWSRSELARHAGLHEDALSRVESGEVVPTLTMLERIAEALGVTLSVSLTTDRTT